MEPVHQFILHMLVTKDLDNKIFDYIYTWGETLSCIAWTVRASYYRNIMITSGQAVFVRDIILDHVSVVDWQVITVAKQQQVGVDNILWILSTRSVSNAPLTCI